MSAKILPWIPFQVCTLVFLLAAAAVAPHGRAAPGGGVFLSLNKVERAGLADVRATVPGVVVDLRYGTANNVTRQKLYPPGMPCLLRKSTARKLAVAQEQLRREGYGLKVWDAYRPPQAHRALWNAAPSTDYVVPPNQGLSLHCAGVAVDVTLVDAQGREMRMPTPYDHFSPAASSTYRGGDPVIQRNLDRLQRAMRRAGFATISNEWWHFDEAGVTSPKAVSASALGIQLPSYVRNLHAF